MVQRCFEGASGYLVVAASPVIMDARAEAQFLASGFSTAAEPSPDLADAWWLPPDGTGRLSRATPSPASEYVFLVTLFPFDGADDTDDALLLDVARDVQARGGGPPRRSAEREVPAELAAVLVADPPAGYRASLPIRIVEDADRYEAPGMTDRLREIFTRESTTVVRTFTDGSVIIVVMLAVQPYEQLAAAELGTIGGIDSTDPATIPGADRIEDAVTFRIEPATLGIAIRSGNHFVMLQGTPQDPSGEAATVDALVDLASRQADAAAGRRHGPVLLPVPDRRGGDRRRRDDRGLSR